MVDFLAMLVPRRVFLSFPPTFSGGILVPVESTDSDIQAVGKSFMGSRGGLQPGIMACAGGDFDPNYGNLKNDLGPKNDG